MITAVWVTAVALAYPVIAGRVYRALARGRPPEPMGCLGRGKSQSGMSPCRQAKTQKFLTITAQYRELYCDECGEWIDWALQYQDVGRWALTGSLLWPLLPLVVVPMRLFRAGANASVTQAPREDRDALV